MWERFHASAEACISPRRRRAKSHERLCTRIIARPRMRTVVDVEPLSVGTHTQGEQMHQYRMLARRLSAVALLALVEAGLSPVAAHADGWRTATAQSWGPTSAAGSANAQAAARSRPGGPGRRGLHRRHLVGDLGIHRPGRLRLRLQRLRHRVLLDSAALHRVADGDAPGRCRLLAGGPVDRVPAGCQRHPRRRRELRRLGPRATRSSTPRRAEPGTSTTPPSRPSAPTDRRYAVTGVGPPTLVSAVRRGRR